MEAALTEKSDLMSKIGDSRGDLDRLARERERLSQDAEQAKSEALELRGVIERMKGEAEEREKTLATFRQQSSSISQLMEV